MQIVRAEFRSFFAIVFFGRGRKRGDLDRVGRLAHIEHPAALNAIGAIVDIALISEDREAAAGQRQRRVGAAAERRAPVAVGEQLWRGRVGDIKDCHSAVAPRGVGKVAADDRMVQRVASVNSTRLPVGPLACFPKTKRELMRLSNAPRSKEPRPLTWVPFFASGTSPSLLNVRGALVGVGSSATGEAPWSPQGEVA
jgi:hypothetical protein